MTVRRLLEKKGRFVSVAPPTARVQDIVDQLERDDVAAVVISAIAHGLKQFGRDVVDRPVWDLMTREVATCDIGEPLSRVYELMDEHQVRHIPITDGGALCGIINTLDVVKHRLAEIDAEAAALKEYISGRT
jgi:CBS domain-containing protein